ncbi:uncharacterized protein LOC115695080 [Cannabis sativa]|uniref:uncharacterized protein LOC115695080 n=1 Tax=Cannabis sativa TaxID=3483 RepID=UPI0011DFBEAA|nr:uncharacterized protein LOC115695080 [Cannabis sativa]
MGKLLKVGFHTSIDGSRESFRDQEEKVGGEGVPLSYATRRMKTLRVTTLDQNFKEDNGKTAKNKGDKPFRETKMEQNGFDEIPFNSIEILLHIEFEGSPPQFATSLVINSIDHFISNKGIALITPGGQYLHRVVKFGFKASNNEAEYDALITGLKLAWELHAKHIEICSDSQLVVNHVSGEYEAQGEKMIAYLRKIQDMLAQFKGYTLRQIPREENRTADALADL